MGSNESGDFEIADGREIIWRIRLFEGPVLESASGEIVKRFRSQKAGALFAYLALRLGRFSSREDIILALWPDEDDLQIVANRLRVTLSSLRRQLEPSGVPYGAVIDVSNPGRISLRSETVWCDVSEFERAFKSGNFREASNLKTGKLLPNLNDDWVLPEQERFERLNAKLSEGTPSQSETAPTETKPEKISPLQSIPYRNLPLYLTKWFGRDGEKRSLRDLLCENRLVTITGPGGIGKTRLSIEYVRENLLFPIFVPLADATSSEDIAEVALRAVGASPASNISPETQLISILTQRESALLILDNAEHVAEGVAGVVLSLLEAIPDLTILVTSRQSLNIAGEKLLPLVSIEAPDFETPFEELSGFPAVALFLDRARNTRPDFALTRRNAASIIEVCRIVEGFPLALELAAARVVMQTPEQIARGLKENLLSLKSHLHGFSVRHRSLRASIQGSYDLLSPMQKLFFTSLSVFQGGWTLDAAAYVSGNENAPQLMEELSKLSLLSIAEDFKSEEMRGTFLEMIRQFAAEQANEEDRPLLTSRHSDYFMSLAKEMTNDDFRSMEPVEGDIQNLLVALENGSKSPDETFWKGLHGSLVFGYVRGRKSVSLPWAKRTLDLLPQVSEVEMRMNLRYDCYQIISYGGDMALTKEIAMQMRIDAQENDSPFGVVLANYIDSFVLTVERRYEEALDLTRASLEDSRKMGNTLAIRRGLTLLGWVCPSYAKDSPGLDEATKKRILLEGEAVNRECLTRISKNNCSNTYLHLSLAYILTEQNRIEEAYAVLKRAQQFALSQRMDSMMIFCIVHEARIAAMFEKWEYAAFCFGSYRALRERTGYVANNPALEFEQFVQGLLKQISEERFEVLASAGANFPISELVELSLEAPPVFSAEGAILNSNSTTKQDS